MSLCSNPPAGSSSRVSVLLLQRFEPTPGRLTPLVAEDTEGEAVVAPVVVPRLWWEPVGASAGRSTRSAVSNSTAAMAAACSASCCLKEFVDVVQAVVCGVDSSNIGVASVAGSRLNCTATALCACAHHTNTHLFAAASSLEHPVFAKSLPFTLWHSWQREGAQEPIPLVLLSGVDGSSCAQALVELIDDALRCHQQLVLRAAAAAATTVLACCCC